ncbi:MAG: hypothetical protein HDR88_19025 [Bacteroides sp.]|nr:hypothetical protein [Bacteroides sp.]
MKKLKQEQQELENRKSELLKEQATKETEIAELEVRRIEKHKALDAESGSALKSDLANIFGKGKYAEIQRENVRLQSEIETTNIERDKARIRVEEMEEQVAQIPRLAEERALIISSSLQSRYDALAKEYRSLESTTATRIERLEREKSDLLARLKAMLDMLHEKLKEAVKAFMEFSKSVLVLRELSIRHRDTIVEYLADSPDVRNAAHTLKVFARPFLDNRQFDKGSKELDRLTSNFPSVLEEVNQTQIRAFRR